MKRLVHLTFIVLLAIVLGACAKATPQPVDEMINPGDKSGDFLITTGELGGVTFGWELDSTKGEEANTVFGDAAWGTKIIPTAGIYDDTFRQVGRELGGFCL
jgi:hypothetical protein